MSLRVEMEWHDAITDPPSETGTYVAAFDFPSYMITLPYSNKHGKWNVNDFDTAEFAAKYEMNPDFWAYRPVLSKEDFHD